MARAFYCTDMKALALLLTFGLTMDENLPRWFTKTKNVSAELALGLGAALLSLQFWLRNLMKPEHYELALTIIIPLFLLTLVLSCSKGLDVLKGIKQQSNGNNK